MPCTYMQRTWGYAETAAKPPGCMLYSNVMITTEMLHKAQHEQKKKKCEALIIYHSWYSEDLLTDAAECAFLQPVASVRIRVYWINILQQTSSCAREVFFSFIIHDLLIHYWFLLKSSLPWGIELLLCQNARQNICASRAVCKGVTGTKGNVLDECTAANPLKWVPVIKIILWKVCCEQWMNSHHNTMHTSKPEYGNESGTVEILVTCHSRF